MKKTQNRTRVGKGCYLGKTGLVISDLVMGTMAFGGDADAKESRKLFETCFEHDIFTFDCADVYNGGKAEELLGKFTSKAREKFVIISKGGLPGGTMTNSGGAGRKHLRNALEQSLRRLKTDYIDVYFVHKFDPQTPLEETFRTLDTFVREGKVHFIGVSNFSAWQTQKALDLCQWLDLEQISCVQPMYNLVKRQCEVEILPQALAEGLGVIPYSPLGAGILTGKYGSCKDDSVKGRLNRIEMYRARYGQGWMFQTADKFIGFCRDCGLEPVATAIAWVKSHPAVSAPILGARSVSQLGPQLESRNVDMASSLRDEISQLSVTPAPATDRIEEQRI